MKRSWLIAAAALLLGGCQTTTFNKGDEARIVYRDIFIPADVQKRYRYVNFPKRVPDLIVKIKDNRISAQDKLALDRLIRSGSTLILMGGVGKPLKKARKQSRREFMLVARYVGYKSRVLKANYNSHTCANCVLIWRK